MKVTFRKLGIALGVVHRGCIATTRDGHRCTRKVYPYCAKHRPKEVRADASGAPSGLPRTGIRAGSFAYPTDYWPESTQAK